jgi:cytidyltransferase-like protein
MAATTTGFLLGKFLPPHRGHQYLIEFARAYVDRLAVLVCSIAREPIPGALRYQWMCESFPGVTLVHHTDEIPQAPEEHAQFWDGRASARSARDAGRPGRSGRPAPPRLASARSAAGRPRRALTISRRAEPDRPPMTFT